MLTDNQVADTSPVEQTALVMLLIVGMYFPTSVNGEHNLGGILIIFAVLVILLTYLAFTRGFNYLQALFVSLPIIVLLTGFTLWALLRGPVEIDAGLLVKFGAIALLYTVDLKRVRLRTFAIHIFTFVNVLNIGLGILILAGNEWVTDFIPRYYWTSDSLLVPHMLELHKPILTFGTHSLAGLFLYLFFWINWEAFRLKGSRLGTGFAIAYLILLLALASFTSLALGAIAAVQISRWIWKRNPLLFAALSLCCAAAIASSLAVVMTQIDLGALPQFAEGAFLNSDTSGPLSRYGSDGELHGEISYLWTHPLSPIGLRQSAPVFDIATSQHFYIGDSGPLEYLVRGSVPLLVLLYYGLYKFLAQNLILPLHARMFFLVVVLFETGFSALTASRSYFLFPFLIVYLNHVANPLMNITAQRSVSSS